MECTRPWAWVDRQLASAGVCDAFGVLACRQGQAGGATGRGEACAVGSEARRHRLICCLIRRSRPAGARPCVDAQAGLDHRPDGAGPGGVAHRGQHDYAALQVGSAHPGRRARERVPAAQWRAWRGTRRARRRGRHQPGATGAVARSRPRNHQEEQARRTPGVRPGAARLVADQDAARLDRHRARSVFAHPGRAGAGSLLRALHGLCGRQVPRHRRRIPVARSGACRPRRQFDRRRLSGAAAGRAAGPGKGRGQILYRQDRRAAQGGFAGRIAGRGVSFQVEPVRRHQQHHAVQPADGRAQHPAHQRARTEVGCGNQGAADQADARYRQADRSFRNSQFRADPRGCRSSGPRCAPSLPNSPPRCSAAIPASRN